MAMRMGMRLAHRPVMRMSVVFVVDVAVLMLQRFVDVFVRMALRKMNPEAGAHQDSREYQSHGQRFAEQDDRQNAADKRGEE